MKLRIVVDLDESAQEVHDEHGDVKSILRRPSVVRAVEKAMISVNGKVTIVPMSLPDQVYTREEHMHDGCL